MVVDQEDNLKAKAWSPGDKGMVYEFSFPLWNEHAGGTIWRRGNAYMIAFLVGRDPEYREITEDSWMSDQVLVRLGGPSEDSIYRRAQNAKSGSKQ